MMLGICAGLTPFPDHSQAPRNVYAAAMSKQSIGMYATSFNERFDTMAHVLHYPQRRLVPTQLCSTGHFEDMPSGINCIVAVACYGGFNQEDSILINRSAIDRGLFVSSSYKTTSICENKKGTHDAEVIEYPSERIQKNTFNYKKLSRTDGIVDVGTIVEREDVLVGKVYYNNDNQVSDCSLVCKLAEEGIVDKVCVTHNAAGYKLVKIRIRKLRIPEIADKFAHLSAQKGTCGMIYPQEDMPFTGEGITPDIIINAHALPSRMTINMLLEMICGKAGTLVGERYDSTAFCHDGEKLVEEMGKILSQKGYEQHGYEVMYNGFTGVPLKSRIFIGPAYYQRLKHLVADKCHSRASGNVQLMSRQPCAGRSRHGGLRFGEMERDCMITHGVSAFLKERLFDMSDPYQLDICVACGNMVHRRNECVACGKDKTEQVQIPYACKLLFQELQAMNIKIKLRPTE